MHTSQMFKQITSSCKALSTQMTFQRIATNDLNHSSSFSSTWTGCGGGCTCSLIDDTISDQIHTYSSSNHWDTSNSSSFLLSQELSLIDSACNNRGSSTFSSFLTCKASENIISPASSSTNALAGDAPCSWAEDWFISASQDAQLELHSWMGHIRDLLLFDCSSILHVYLRNIRMLWLLMCYSSSHIIKHSICDVLIDDTQFIQTHPGQDGL